MGNGENEEKGPRKWNEWAETIFYRLTRVEGEVVKLREAEDRLTRELLILKTKIGVWVIGLGIAATFVTNIIMAVLKWYLTR